MNVKLTLIYKAPFMAVGTKEDWNASVISIQKEVKRILEFFVKFPISSRLGTRSCATKACLAPQHFLSLKFKCYVKFSTYSKLYYRMIKKGIHDVLCRSFPQALNN